MVTVVGWVTVAVTVVGAGVTVEVTVDGTQMEEGDEVDVLLEQLQRHV